MNTQNKEIIANKIRDFYDRNPYPRPQKSLNGYRQQWQDEDRRRVDFHLFWPAKAYQEDLEILVAGCGTSQAARYALRYPQAQVIGIDVSSRSIMETEKLKRRHELVNLELEQLSLERVKELGREFDKIICTGVLHHLPDPDAGLHALQEVLKLDGAMHLMVYAEYGRMGIYMIQEYCRRLGIGTTETDIMDLANTLMAMPVDHPLGRLLAESPDFRSKAALADALLHPQDRAYTVPEFFDFIRGNGLRFGRWLRQAPYLPYCGDLANTPHTPKLIGLPEEEQYAAVELFRGTMLRHSAIVYREDYLHKAQAIQFGDDQWRNYIPHRLSKTIVVEEDLPKGAAGVMINQGHTYPDIYLPVNQKEKQLVQAINGRNTIAEIGRRVGINNPELICTFFQKLWWYDQIVFEVRG